MNAVNSKQQSKECDLYSINEHAQNVNALKACNGVGGQPLREHTYILHTRILSQSH